MDLSIRNGEDWDGLFSGENLRHLEEKLPEFIVRQRWFGGKSRTISSVAVIDWGVFDQSRSVLSLIRVTYRDGDLETYLLPLGMSFGDAGHDLEAQFPAAILASTVLNDPLNGLRRGVLRDGLFSNTMLSALLSLIADGGAVVMKHGTVRGLSSSILSSLQGDGSSLSPRRSLAEQSNSSIFFGDKLIMKVFRKQQAGTNPDTEIGRYLTEHSTFLNIAPFGGSIEYLSDTVEGDSIHTLAMLQGLVANEGDGWTWTLGELDRYYQGAVDVDIPGEDEPLPEGADEALSICVDAAATLGRRTAELHLALGQKTMDVDFDPEPFAQANAEALREEVILNAARAFALLSATVSGLPEESALAAAAVLGRRDLIFQRLSALGTREVGGMRTRVHGDYHLGQVLRTDRDFVLLDFEGEPARSLAERRAKQSPLKDVAGMLRSFSYAAFAALTQLAEAGEHDATGLEQWARLWESAVSGEFLSAYREAVGNSPIVPSEPGAFQSLLDAYVLDKALYELVYELNNRPAWVGIPLHGILALTSTQ